MTAATITCTGGRNVTGSPQCPAGGLPREPAGDAPP
jgi:hypothetical protein